ncbi:MAG: glycosyl hydrolase family 18 protein [Clostridium sp.]|uniref:glycosyl hydrolase family 18 protein n=1 Tax=Clostridium sp. TaxID=1506 RepID=UPI0029071FC1|nr:glycosyl hydrolase family 18 protein [Clostridium sp.]MDU5109139.1 glycosyl hydrolase family 18 protein [Clostridium sp.]
MKKGLVNKIMIFLIVVLAIFLIFLFINKVDRNLFNSSFKNNKEGIIEKDNNNYNDDMNSVDNGGSYVDNKQNSLNGVKISTWVTYWDLPAKTFSENMSGDIKNVSYFAANFNENNKLVVPDKLKDFYNDTEGSNFKKYLTIVNDVIKSDGSSIQKDTEVLKILLYDKSYRENHINEIVNLAIYYGFDGIEIDYERLKKDMTLWENFIIFIKELYSKASEKGLDLRVVLEPNIPFENLNFENGPTYVVMCYNLHGGFSGPGEKANPEFITSLIEEMNKYEVKKDFALATGGFDWPEGASGSANGNGKVKSVTEKEAKSLMIEYNAEAIRDEESKYLYFKYKDEDNINHEVWYADNETLNYLSSFILEGGYDVSLWRVE